MKKPQSANSRASGKPKKKLVVVAVMLWVSFLSAGVATMLFFSAFDPSVIAELATFPIEIDRSTGYSLGFFLFWLLLVTNNVVVIWLLERNSQ